MASAWTRCWKITTPLFRSELRWKALGLLGLLIAFLLTISGLNVLNSFVGRDFMTSIEERQADRFTWLALLWAGVFVTSTIVGVFKAYTEERFGLWWREWLTRHLMDRYLAGRAYHRLNGRADIDNPDQRIAEDVRSFTSGLLSIFLIVLNSSITLVSFCGVLWTITPWLFVAAVGYAAFGSLMSILLGRRLVGLDVLQLKKEANFRYELVRVRQNAERIALLRGERQENGRLRRKLAEAVANMRIIIGVNRRLGFFTNGYNYMIQLVPLLIAGPLFIQGQIHFGAVTQSVMAFTHVLGAFSLVVVEFQRVSTFAAVSERLGRAWEAIGEEETPVQEKAAIEVEDGPRLIFERLTLTTPRDGRALVEELDLDVPACARLLITGPSGSGRSVLLRAIAGLWPHGAGHVVRPPLDETLFVAAQPFLWAGSLREQLVYGSDRPVADAELLAVLRQVRFSRVLRRVGGLDAEQDWPNTLSLGEQQLLSFARLLLSRPRYAFLDEATSALDPARTRHLYRALGQASIAFVTVADDDSLADFHDLVLELRGNGVWRVGVKQKAASA